MVTEVSIVKALKQLGVDKGCKVLVHSSLSSFGYVEGGANAVIDAILKAVGPNGTMMVPTLTGHKELSIHTPPIFDPKKSTCWTGVIPETVRKRDNATRSIHPTHSVAAIGADAKFLTKDHIFSITPCDELSPYGKLTDFDDSFILLIGVDHRSSTMFHHIEEVAGVDYHIQEGFAHTTIIIDDVEINRHKMLHKYGTARNFNIMEPVFLEQGIQRNIRVGSSEIRLVNVKGMVRTTTFALRANPHILCAK